MFFSCWPHQEIETEALYYIHYANAFDDGEETVLRGSAWGPEGVAKLASNPRNGILGSWDDLMEGNFTAV
jgi:carotenoid cleavage dioxygenase-like enzyme